MFGPLLQRNLDDIVELWNNHYIRVSPHGQISGRPNELYYYPELHNFDDQSFPLDPGDFQELNSYLTDNENQEGDQFKRYYSYISGELGVLKPKTWDEAKNLFILLLSHAR